jgi:hypothetical protein
MGPEGTHGVRARFQSVGLIRAASQRLSLSTSTLERLQLYVSIDTYSGSSGPLYSVGGEGM